MLVLGFIFLIISVLAFVDWTIISLTDNYLSGILSSIFADIGIIGFILLCCAGV